MLSGIFITITGFKSYHGKTPFSIGAQLLCCKDPQNAYDSEAIRVLAPGGDTVGYVANSTHTVKGDCYSAGRLYDKIGNTAVAKVKYILCDAVICKVKADTAAAVPPMNPDTGLPYGSEEEAIAF